MDTVALKKLELLIHPEKKLLIWMKGPAESEAWIESKVIDFLLLLMEIIGFCALYLLNVDEVKAMDSESKILMAPAKSEKFSLEKRTDPQS